MSCRVIARRPARRFAAWLPGGTRVLIRRDQEPRPRGRESVDETSPACVGSPQWVLHSATLPISPLRGAVEDWWPERPAPRRTSSTPSRGAAAVKHPCSGQPGESDIRAFGARAEPAWSLDRQRAARAAGREGGLVGGVHRMEHPKRSLLIPRVTVCRAAAMLNDFCRSVVSGVSHHRAAVCQTSDTPILPGGPRR